MKTKRQGFTLIEMLVVIAITSILASIGFVMVKNFGQTSRDAQTVATLKKCDGVLNDRYESLGRFFEYADRRGVGSDIPVYVEGQDRGRWSDNGNGAPPRPVVELLARKKYERRSCPMTFDEGPFDNSTPPLSLITGLEKGQFPPGHDGGGKDTESAEALYWILTNAGNFGSESVATIDFIDREIADTDNDGLMEVVDGWGNPLRFYRWPTRMIRPRPLGSETIPAQNSDDPPIDKNRAAVLLSSNALANQQLKQDPQDPEARIPYSNYPLDQFEMDYYTANTWHAPLIVSAGPDGIFGIYSPVKDTSYFGHLAQPDNTNDPTGEFLTDNITNLVLRVGGK